MHSVQLLGSEAEMPVCIVHPIQYEHAPLWVRCAMLRKHPPVDPVLSILSCFRKPSVGVCQVVGNSPDPGIAWPSARFPPDLWRWFEEDTASIRRLIHPGYMAKQREATGLDNRGNWIVIIQYPWFPLLGEVPTSPRPRRPNDEPQPCRRRT